MASSQPDGYGDDFPDSVREVPVASPVKPNEVRIVVAQLAWNYFESRVPGRTTYIGTAPTFDGAVSKMLARHPELWDTAVVSAERRIDPSLEGR